MKVFSLSLSKLRKLNFSQYEKDFNFIYRQEIFPCNKLVADFLSPIVQKIHLTDPSLEEFVISDKEKHQPSIFNEVIQSGEFQEIQITEKNAKALRYFYNELGNNEFSEFILFNKSNIEKKSNSKATPKGNESSNNSSHLNVNSVFQQLRIKSALGLSLDQEIEFISMHLYELEKQFENEKSILTIDTLQMILSSPKICISSEEWLFKYIMKRSEENKEFLCLFEYVKFSQLSRKSVETFFEKVPVDEMNQSVYNSIIELAMNSFNSSENSSKASTVKSNRYHKDPNAKEKENEKKIEKEKKIKYAPMQFDGKNPLNGIFSFLRSKYPNAQNIASAGIIEITSSSNADNNNSDLSHLVDLDRQTLFISKNEPNQWITFDFKNMRIIPQCYTLITNHNAANGDHMKSWVLEVSDDNVNFTNITTETNNVTLNGPGHIVVFRAFNPHKGRYVRIRQTGPNWHNSHFLVLSQVEFFGELSENC